MPIYALTGELASGKSSVLALLKQKGANVFNADERVHSLYKDKKGKVYKEIASLFPQALSQGAIERSLLAGIAFANKRNLKAIEHVVHPAVIDDLKRWVRSADRKKVYVAEVPLLFEKKLDDLFDKVILVRVARAVLVKRIMRAHRLTAAQARRRLSLFMPLRTKAEKADFVIDNSSSRMALRKAIVSLWQAL